MIRIITYIYHITRDFRDGIRNETNCDLLVPSRSRDGINFEIPVPNPDGTGNSVGTARPCGQPGKIIAIARAEKFIENQFVRTNAIENVKKLKINQNRRFMQKKKIISIAKCKKMIDIKRVEKDRLKLNREMKQIRLRRAR